MFGSRGYGSNSGLISEKTEAFYTKRNIWMVAATSSYSVTDNFLQYIYSVPVK